MKTLISHNPENTTCPWNIYIKHEVKQNNAEQEKAIEKKTYLK